MVPKKCPEQSPIIGYRNLLRNPGNARLQNIFKHFHMLPVSKRQAFLKSERGGNRERERGREGERDRVDRAKRCRESDYE